MRIYLDCWPCFLRQALSGTRRTGAGPEEQRQVLLGTMAILESMPREATPPEMAERIHRLVRELTGHVDPYVEAKREATRSALTLRPKLSAMVEGADDRLETAVRVAIAGNIIDHGVAESYDLASTLERVLAQPFAISGLDELRLALAEASWVLYLADNAGETVFDRLLIEALGRPVVYVVKGGPALNDATREDALEAGLHEVAEIVDTGACAVGTPLPLCSAEFRRRFEEAPLIIAKGQANYETLSSVEAPVFFLLQIKCEVIGQDLGVGKGEIVLVPPGRGERRKVG
ncbi:MAG: damage-control phosphatase ARMT1 family protein [Myxococcota bacterium]